MSQRTPYLITHPESEKYWFRRRVPGHLHRAIGRQEIKVSLQTSITREAIRRCRITANEVDKLFLEAEKWREGACPLNAVANLRALQAEFDDPDAVTEPLERWMIPTILARYQEAVLAGHELQCQSMLPDELTPAEAADPVKRAAHEKAEDEAFAALDAETQELQEQLKRLERAKMFKRLSVIEDSAAAHLYAERLSPLATDPIVLDDYKFELLRKEIEVIKQLIERQSGVDIPTPNAQTESPEHVNNWETMLKTWKESRLPREKSYDEAVRFLKQFQALHGELAPTEITEEHVEAWVQQLKSENLNLQTVKKKVALLRAVFAAAIEEKVVSTRVNPFGLVKVRISKKHRMLAKEARQPFEMEQLNAIFRTPVYLAGDRPGKGGGDAAYWIPLIALTTGARLEEIGQLFVKDVCHRSGRLWIRFTELDETQFVKNESALREVPVHPELLKIGFKAFVNTMREQGHERLFPLLRLNKYQQYTAIFSTWFNEYLDEHVTSDSRYTFHSFRHNMKDFGIESGVSAPLLDNFMGHSLEGMTDRYGRKSGGRRKFSDKALIHAVDTITFEGVDLSHLYVAPTAA